MLGVRTVQYHVALPEYFSLMMCRTHQGGIGVRVRVQACAAGRRQASVSGASQLIAVCAKDILNLSVLTKLTKLTLQVPCPLITLTL